MPDMATESLLSRVIFGINTYLRNASIRNSAKFISLNCECLPELSCPQTASKNLHPDTGDGELALQSPIRYQYLFAERPPPKFRHLKSTLPSAFYFPLIFTPQPAYG